MSGLNSEACNLCHPSGHAGNTDCLRDRHASLKSAGITCVNCHGRIEDHALSLLAGQSGIRRAGILMANLETTAVKDKKEIRSRTPWINEPQCSGCHSGYRIEKGSPLSAFNSWSEGFDNLYRNSMDDRGVMCSACHSSTHAIYGARNIYEKHRDNIQPLQYQKLAGTIGTRGNCAVCHTVAMKDSAHHENIIGRKKQAAIVK
jgi:uncharacterized CHY-type Zn-finger protein